MFPQRETAHVFPSSEGLGVCFCGYKFLKVNNIRNVILKNLRANRASCFECYFVFKAIFSFALMQKKQKIKPEYFYPKIIGQISLSRPQPLVFHTRSGVTPFGLR